MFNEIIANTSKIIISNADKIKLTLAAIFSEGLKGYSLHLIYYPVIFLDLIFFLMGS